MGNNATHGLRQEVINDIEARTPLSAEQIRRLFRDFSLLTKRKSWSQSVSCDALTSLYDKAYQGEPHEFARRMFNVMDTDRNGGVDFREFVTSFVQLNGTEEQKLVWLFSLYDVDQRGFIYYDDLCKVVQALLDLLSNDAFGCENNAERIADQILKSVDKNQDKRISTAEFIEGATSCAALGELLEVSNTVARTAFEVNPDKPNIIDRRWSSTGVSQPTGPRSKRRARTETT